MKGTIAERFMSLLKIRKENHCRGKKEQIFKRIYKITNI